MDSQLDLFDARPAIAVTDRAVRRSFTAADTKWRQAAYQAIVDIASAQHRFTTDTVWERISSPREPRALGGVMRLARQNAIIASTDDFELTTRPERHRAPVRVWRSLVKR